MALIVLRRSRNMRRYCLVERYGHNQGKKRRPPLYLARKKDGTDTPDKPVGHCVHEQAQRLPFHQ
jgi:hypothetical protein